MAAVCLPASTRVILSAQICPDGHSRTTREALRPGCTLTTRQERSLHTCERPQHFMSQPGKKKPARIILAKM